MINDLAWSAILYGVKSQYLFAVELWVESEIQGYDNSSIKINRGLRAKKV